MLYFDLFCNRKGKKSLHIPKPFVTFTDTNQVPQLWDRPVPGVSTQNNSLHIRADTVRLAKL